MRCGGGVIGQDVSEHGFLQPARRGVAAKSLVGDDAVDRVRHPVGVEDAGFAQRLARLVSEIEHHAQIVHQQEQGFLVSGVGDAVFCANLGVALAGDDVAAFLFRFQRRFDVQMGVGEEDAHMGQRFDCFSKGSAQFFDAASFRGGGLNERADAELALEAVFRQIQLMLGGVRLTAGDEDGGFGGEGADGAQPVGDAVLVVGVADVQHQQVNAAFREEEGMGAVHELLPAEIPDAGGVFAQREGVGFDGEGALAVGVVGVLQQAVDEGGLSDAGLADDQQARLAQRPAAAFPEGAVEVEDGLGVFIFQ